MPSKVCIIGMGYVGLPLAIAFSKESKVIGFDINKEKIESLKQGIDITKETAKEELLSSNIEFTVNPEKIRESDFIIIAVPTPIDEDKIPDLSYLKSASELVGQNLKKGSIVVYESTVYPGATEEVCLPILERESGLKCPEDFKIGYSPERINPGDKEHTVTKILKVVSGIDKDSTEKIAETYNRAITAGVYKAKNIKTAEAAKVIENIQRDLNIALVNELSLIFERIGINTRDVIEAAGTKWNFHKYYPGLVGGHCIGIDPYYLTYKAKHLGYNPRVILAGREINEFMSKHLTNMILNSLTKQKKHIIGSKVLIIGLTFKENVPDTRNSKIKDVIRYLKKYSVEISAIDPLISEQEIKSFGVQQYKQGDKFDCIVVFSPHDEFKEMSINKLKELAAERPTLIDLKEFYNKEQAEEKGFYYKTL